MVLSRRTIEFDQSLQDLCAAAAHAAERTGRPAVVSQTVPWPDPDPVDFFARGGRTAADRIFWSAPGGPTLVGVGAAQCIAADGPARFEQVRALWEELQDGPIFRDSGKGAEAWDANGAACHRFPAAPVLLGGFAFDSAPSGSGLWGDFPAGFFLLPRLLLTVLRGRASLTAHAVLRPGDDPWAAAGGLEAERAALARVTSSPAREGRNGHVRGHGGDNGRGSQDGHSLTLQAEHGLALREEDPGPWMAAVAAARQAVRDGLIAKVVLARQVRVRANGTLSPEAVLRALLLQQAESHVFAVARGATCFLGASPEELARVRGRHLQTMCLAGTAARGDGPEEDRRLGQSLLESDKDRAEHAVVLQAVREALEGVSLDVTAPPGPATLKVRAVQHLCTPVTGWLEEGRSILDVVERLHPTPAVGGSPRAAALEWIRRHEGLDRGWYAGPVGWLDSRGDGHFAVAIRSALVRGPEGVLFAGCGIMGNSSPEREYEESCLKLQPMLDALRAAVA